MNASDAFFRPRAFLFSRTGMTERGSVVCDNCHTTLPDSAVACWKCGKQFSSASPPAPRKSGPDLLLAIVTLPIAVISFACLGWTIPFTLWGLVVSSASQYPGWSGLLGALGAILFVLATVAVIGGTWWGAYWILNRVNAPPSR